MYEAKLYRCSVTLEIVVVAHNKTEALAAAREHAGDEWTNGPYPDLRAFAITEIKSRDDVPKQWARAIPYSSSLAEWDVDEDPSDRTVTQILRRSY